MTVTEPPAVATTSTGGTPIPLRVVNRQCTLCEAHCGIRVEVAGEKVVRITGDPDDAHSRGFVCPKGTALVDLLEDPDRLRRPVKRVGETFVEIGWDEAFRLVGEGLRGVRSRHGRDAIATYLGNPGAHSSGAIAMFTLRMLLRSANNYSAVSTDTLPQHRSSFEMFGSLGTLPVPDIERTAYLLVLGANPAVSNGSVMSTPDVRRRLKAIRQRGGTVVVVDPRRTETASDASEHVSIRPGGDPFLLLGMLHVIVADGLVAPGRMADRIEGLDDVRALVVGWTPERAATLSGVDAATITRLAREFATASSAVAYGRVGVCHQRNGTLTHWLLNVLNIVTGNLDSEGGAMFPTPPVEVFRMLGHLPVAKRVAHRHQRVSGLPGFVDEFPLAGLADEILTPGEGQVRALISFAGNPALSGPAGRRLEEGLASLDFFVAVDMYVTETTRHAHVILPPLSHLERSDIDLFSSSVAVHNHVHYNRAAVAAPTDGRTDFEILLRIAAEIGVGVRGRVQNTVIGALGSRLTPELIADLGMRTGPYGVLKRGPRRGLSLKKVQAASSGLDLGPLEPRLPALLMTPGKKVRLATPPLLEEATRLERIAAEQEAAAAAGYDLVLIGRRQLRSNNSWLHNSPRLMKGADRCTALLHPEDAAARGIADGDRVRVTSVVGAIEVPVSVSDEIRPGVVSVPHGFGHHRPGVGWQLAAAKPGTSVNDITDPSVVDEMTGNAAFNAVPVKVELVDG